MNIIVLDLEFTSINKEQIINESLLKVYHNY